MTTNMFSLWENMLLLLLFLCYNTHALNCSLTYNSTIDMQKQLVGRNFVIPFASDSTFEDFSRLVLKEVATRGGFTFTTLDTEPLSIGEKNTDGLKKLMADENNTHSDVFGSYWTDTSSRRQIGALFSAHFIDTTRVIVTFQDSVIEQEFVDRIFTFLKPFRAEMWVAIAVGCIISGIATHWLELSTMAGQGKRYRKALKDAKGVRWKTFIPYLFRSFGHFANSGHTLYAHTVAGKLHNVVWAFLVLIILAAYLANLASFLAVQDKLAPTYQNINAILLAKATLCVDPLDDIANEYLTSYPNLKRYPLNPSWMPENGKKRYEGLLQLMRGGTCVAMVVRENQFAALEMDDKNCDLRKRDPLSPPIGGGFAFPPDKCGPLMLAVFDSILVGMQANGTIDAYWKQSIPPSLCPSPPAFFTEASGTALKVEKFAGLFLLYLSFVIIAIGLRILRKVCLRAEKKVLSRLSKIENETAMVEFGDTNIQVNQSNGDASLDERVARIDRVMAEILSSVQHLAHPATNEPVVAPTTPELVSAPEPAAVTPS